MSGPRGKESDRPPPLQPEPSRAHFVVGPHRFDLKRVARKVAAVVALGVTAVAATAGGVLLHMDIPPARRLASAAVNGLLHGTFRGKLEILRLTRLEPDGIDGGVVALADPDGTRVALLEGVHARIALFPLLASILSGGELRVTVRELSIDHIDVLLAPAPDGSLTITEAFQPATQGPPPSPDASGKGLALSLSKIAIKHAWVHGAVATAPPIDADLDDLAASFGMDPERTSADLHHLRVSTRGMPMRADVGANLEAHLVLPASGDGASGSVVFDGTVGGIDVAIRGGVHGKQVDASIDVPEVVPSQVDRLVGESPIRQLVSAHAEAHGVLPHVQPALHVKVGGGTIDLRGDVTIPGEGQPETRAQITLTARSLDARAAAPDGAASKIDVDASASARIAGGAVDGTYDVHILPGKYGADVTPDARIVGAFTPAAVRGSAHVFEPGVNGDVHFELSPLTKGGPDVVFDASVRAHDLARIAQTGGSFEGRATVHAAGSVNLGARSVNANLESAVDNFAGAGVAFDELRVSAAVTGALASPSAAVAVDARNLRAGSYAYPLVTATLEGTPEEARIRADMTGGRDPAVSARATVGAAAGLSARDVVVALSKDEDKITARVASARSRAGQVDVEGIRVEGAGQPLEGEVHARAGSLAVKMTGADVHLPTLARIAGLRPPLRQGNVGVDVDVSATRASTTGHVDVTLRDLAYGDVVRGLQAKLGMMLDGRSADVHLDARDAAGETVTLDTENGHLAGGALAPRAWEGATGRVHAALNADLDRVSKTAGSKLPFDELHGWLTAHVDVTRDDDKRRPAIALSAATRNLALTTEPQTVPNGDGTATMAGRAFHTEGLDARVTGHLDGETGDAGVDLLLQDKRGKLLGANGSTTLPVTALLAGDSRDALLAMRVKAHAEVPLRSIGEIPALLGIVPVQGELGLMLDAEGSANEPNLRAVIHAREITDAGDPTPIPISLDGEATYDGANARAQIVALRAEAKVLEVKGAVALRASDLLTGSAAWEASGDATFSKFPIGSVTGFVDENAVDGDLSGSIALRDLHKAGRLDASLDLAHIDINGMKFGDTSAKVALRDGSLTAEARVAQPDGFATVSVATGVGWGDAVSPTLDQTRPIEAALRARNFRLAMIAPFVGNVAGELDGRLTADTKLHVEPGMKGGAMDGAVLVDHGLFETATVGEEIHNLRARIFMKPWGVWNVEEISADGTTGHFTASALARLDGLTFRSGEAHLKIEEKNKVPLAVRGLELGTVWGQIDAKAAATADRKAINVDVAVPSLHVSLPDSTGHVVQSTTPDPTIKIGAIEKDGVVVLLPIDGAAPQVTPPKPKSEGPSAPVTTLHIATHLGPDFEVRRGTMLRAFVTDGPTIDIGKETVISGKIAIPRGYVELQDKRFQIDKGLLTFTGQPPGDPVAVASASYDAPDGTKVFADFVGQVTTGKLTLHSEPQLSQNEILALLLFGTADGTFGQAAPPGQQGNGGTQAASLAGGVVTQGLNKAISGVSGVEVPTKVDTQESGDPRPEVEVALTRDISATIIYNLGVPPPGQNPDDTLLVVDWRFNKGYSTEATLGDRGTSILDLTWKYRY